MSLTQSTKKKDAGRIPGQWNCPSVVEVTLQFQLPNNKLSFGKLHGSFVSTPSSIQSIATALASSLSSAWQSNLATYMHTSMTFQQVSCRDMTSFSNPVYFATIAGVVGTGTGPALPESNAIVLTEQIASRGRGLKGRMYLGGWVQSTDVTIGGISTAVQTAINAMGTAWLNALNAQSLTPCVAQAPRNAYIGYTGTPHAARGSAGPPPVGTHVAVTAYTCRDLVWDTQRRRIQP